jgi:hypothetical protein
MNVKIDLSSLFALLGRRVRRRDSRQGWLPIPWMPFGVVEQMESTLLSTVLELEVQNIDHSTNGIGRTYRRAYGTALDDVDSQSSGDDNASWRLSESDLLVYLVSL